MKKGLSFAEIGLRMQISRVAAFRLYSRSKRASDR